jgi:hypothetical protein
MIFDSKENGNSNINSTRRGGLVSVGGSGLEKREERAFWFFDMVVARALGSTKRLCVCTAKSVVARVLRVLGALAVHTREDSIRERTHILLTFWCAFLSLAPKRLM